MPAPGDRHTARRRLAVAVGVAAAAFVGVALAATGGPVPLAVEGSDGWSSGCRGSTPTRSSPRVPSRPRCDPARLRLRRRRRRRGVRADRRAARRRRADVSSSVGPIVRAVRLSAATARPSRPPERGAADRHPGGADAVDDRLDALAAGPVDDVIVACWVRLEEAAAAGGVGPPTVGDVRRAGRADAGQLPRAAMPPSIGCSSCTGPLATPATGSARTTGRPPSPPWPRSATPSGSCRRDERSRARSTGRGSARNLGPVCSPSPSASPSWSSSSPGGSRGSTTSWPWPASAPSPPLRCGGSARRWPKRCGRLRSRPGRSRPASTTGSSSLETMLRRSAEDHTMFERRLRPLLEDLAAHRLSRQPRRRSGHPARRGPAAARRRDLGARDAAGRPTPVTPARIERAVAAIEQL